MGVERASNLRQESRSTGRGRFVGPDSLPAFVADPSTTSLTYVRLREFYVYWFPAWLSGCMATYALKAVAVWYYQFRLLRVRVYYPETRSLFQLDFTLGLGFIVESIMRGV